jgi:hypothetical protein
VQNELLADVFGRRVGNTYEEGLVDSISSDDFDGKLSVLLPIGI